MRKFHLFGLVVFVLFSMACDASKTEPNTANNLQNKNTSTETSSNENSEERHIKVKSENSFDKTYEALKKAIESKEPLTIIAELDHAENAKKANMELSPTKVIMFGNPNLGTPLMKANQAIGIDLPQKMLVFEDEKGDVYVVYNDPNVLAENHGISGQDEILNKITAALKGLAETAARKGEN